MTNTNNWAPYLENKGLDLSNLSPLINIIDDDCDCTPPLDSSAEFEGVIYIDDFRKDRNTYYKDLTPLNFNFE